MPGDSDSLLSLSLRCNFTKTARPSFSIKIMDYSIEFLTHTYGFKYHIYSIFCNHNFLIPLNQRSKKHDLLYSKTNRKYNMKKKKRNSSDSVILINTQ